MSVSAPRLMSRQALIWARSVLAADGTILTNLPDEADSLFGGDPRQGAERPYGVIQVMATPAPLRRPLGDTRIWTVTRLLVKWVGKPEHDETLALLADRADELLEGRQNEAVDGALMRGCLRDGEFSPPADVLSGELTLQRGAFYAVTMQEVS